MTEPSTPPQPAFPTVYAPTPVTWHSRVVLLSVAGLAVVAAILTAVGSTGFPGAAPVEQLYCYGLIVDLVAVAVVVGVLAIIEFIRRADRPRYERPFNRRLSVFAILALFLSAIALFAWCAAGGAEQFGYLLGGLRTRYMTATGSLFAAGIPWALGAIFGVWGFRPRANRATNVLAIVAMIIWLALAVFSTIAALVYGAGLSD
ncbi:hypothetical protein BH09ACT4_BH09ACT4_25790 [soil metagenome]